jgi:hypothetical protein
VVLGKLTQYQGMFGDVLLVAMGRIVAFILLTTMPTLRQTLAAEKSKRTQYGEVFLL